MCRVVGFEPQPEALARLRAKAGPLEAYRPEAVGDGKAHELRLCRTSGFASLLEPDGDQLAVLTDFPRLAAVTDRVRVQTTRLDAVPGIDHLDYLKIDIQGGELAVFRGGIRALSGCVAIQTEVGFHRLYENQPTFADVDLELREQGFVPHRFVTVRDWPLHPVAWADPLQETSRHLVEADLLYVRDLARLEEVGAESLRHLALVAHHVYGDHGIAYVCIGELVRRGALPPSAREDYRSIALPTKRQGPSTG